METEAEKKYEQMIYELIPLATRITNSMNPTSDTEWDVIFHDTMDRLAEARGIRRQSWQVQKTKR